MTGENADLIGGENLSENPLYVVLVKELPEFRSARNNDLLDCYKLAEALGMSHQAVYKWFDRTAIPPKRVTKLINLPGSRLTLEKSLAFALA